jgi:hypothetical protein
VAAWVKTGLNTKGAKDARKSTKTKKERNHEDTRHEESKTFDHLFFVPLRVFVVINKTAPEARTSGAAG